MSVYKDKKTGTWQVSYHVKELPTGTFKHKHKRGFKTAKEAKQWEYEHYYGVDPGTDTTTWEDKTLEELATEWQDYRQLKPESRRHYTEHIRYRFGELREKTIKDISKFDLVSWRNWLANSEYSTLVKNATITYIRSIYIYLDEVYGGPNNGVVLKRLKKTNTEIMHEMQTWTPDEFDQFIKWVDDDIFKVFFEFLYWTGCRRGEAIALQCKDVYPKKVYICHSQRTQKEGLKPTKTKSNRWVTLDDQLARDINFLKTRTDGYLFSNDGGKTGLSPNMIESRFNEAIGLSGVKKIRIHDLRHSHATWLINNGVNIVAVSKRLGHATIEQTLKTYTHLVDQSDIHMITTLNQFRKVEEMKKEDSKSPQ